MGGRVKVVKHYGTDEITIIWQPVNVTTDEIVEVI